MQNDEPLLSVVTITYRDDDGLRRTRRSVEGQTLYTHIEHVIVDGGSGQEVEAYLGSLAADVVWVSEPDEGRYDAMNKGVTLSRGRFLWFMNSGDIFADPEAVQRAMAHLDSENSWGYGYARFRDQSGRYFGLFGHLPFRMDRFALGGQAIPHQAAVFGRNLIKSIGPYDAAHGTAADQLFMLACAAKESPHSIPEILADFDISGVGSNRPLWHYYRDMMRARHKLGVVVLKNRWIADLATVVLFASAVMRRQLEKLVRGHSGHHT